jgi:hypothetical protein
MGFDTTTGIISGVASLPVPGIFLVEAVDAANPANASTIRVLAIANALPGSGTCGSVNCASLLNGRFVIELSGYQGGKPSTTGAATGWAALGSLAFDGSGNISGTIDYNDASTTGTAATLTVSGVYSLGTDGRGTLLLSSGTGSMPQQYTFAVSQSKTYLNLQEFDYANPTSTTTGLATGIGKLQTPGASNPSTSDQPYVFGMDGETPCSSCHGTVSPYGPLSVAGEFANLGEFLSGEEDAAAINNAYPQVHISSPELSAPNSTTGRGTITLYGGSYPAPTSDYVFYVVNSSEFMLLSVDGHATTSLLVGDALLQTASFNTFAPNNNNNFAGKYILTQNASYNGDGVNFYPNTSNVALGYIASSGSGVASILQDQNTAGIITPGSSFTDQPYSIDQYGRMTFTGISPTLYLANLNGGFGTLQPNTAANGGGVPGLLTLTQQSGNNFSCSSVSGTYSFGNPRPPTPMSTNTGVVTFSGTTGTATSDNVNPSAALGSGNSNTYTCSTDSLSSGIGRLKLTDASGGSNVVYIISPTQAVLMNTTPNKTKPALTFLQSQ